jgi:hypothetical protein
MGSCLSEHEYEGLLHHHDIASLCRPLLAARCSPNRFGIIVGDVFSGHPFARATTAERTKNVHQAT